MITRQLERIMSGRVSAPVIVKVRPQFLPNLREFLRLNFNFRGLHIPRFNMFSSILPVDVIDEVKQLGFVDRIYLDRRMGIPEIKDLTIAEFSPVRRPLSRFREIIARRALRTPKAEWTPTSQSRKLVEADLAQREGYEGQGVRIAIVDSDGSYRFRKHRQLRGRTESALAIRESYDLCGHGSHVATIAGGSRYEFQGRITVEGVAPKCELLGVKVLRGAMGLGSASTIIKGIEAALDWNADIINLSVGGEATKTPEEDPLYLVFEELKDKVVSVAAIGNDGPDPATTNAPGCLPNVIGVGATDIEGNLMMFSSRGPTPDGRIKPDCLAPGHNIFSGITIETYMDYIGDYLGNGFGPLSGTSMAAPHVAGLCALAVERDRERGVKLTTERVFKILRRDEVVKWSWFKE